MVWGHGLVLSIILFDALCGSWFPLLSCFTTDAYLLSWWRVDSFSLSHPRSMTFQYDPSFGLCAYPGHINTVPACTTSLKLVLVLASNPLLLPLPSPLRKILVSKFFNIRTCIILGCQYDGLVVVHPLSSWLPIGRMSVSLWVSPAQEAGRKEYARVGLASLTKELAFPLSSSVTKGPLVASSNCHVKPTTHCPFCYQLKDHRDSHQMSQWIWWKSQKCPSLVGLRPTIPLDQQHLVLQQQ